MVFTTGVLQDEANNIQAFVNCSLLSLSSSYLLFFSSLLTNSCHPRALHFNEMAGNQSGNNIDNARVRKHFAQGYADMATSLFQQGFLDRAEQAFKNSLAVDEVCLRDD